MAREGGGCRVTNVDVDGAVNDAEKDDGEAYGGESDDVCDCTSGDDTVGEDRLDTDLGGQLESLFLSLIGGLSSLVLARRALPPAGVAEDPDLTADGAVDPEDETEFEEPRVLTEPLPEAYTAFGVEDGLGGKISVRVEDSLEDGELEGVAVACCEISDDVRESPGRGSFGNGSAGGGEMVPDAG